MDITKLTRLHLTACPLRSKPQVSLVVRLLNKEVNAPPAKRVACMGTLKGSRSYQIFSCSWILYFFSYQCTYFLICSSSNPTVLTQ